MSFGVPAAVGGQNVRLRWLGTKMLKS